MLHWSGDSAPEVQVARGRHALELVASLETGSPSVTLELTEPRDVTHPTDTSLRSQQLLDTRVHSTRDRERPPVPDSVRLLPAPSPSVTESPAESLPSLAELVASVRPNSDTVRSEDRDTDSRIEKPRTEQTPQPQTAQPSRGQPDGNATVSSPSSAGSSGSEGVELPQVVNNPSPDYPAEALAAGKEGRVVLRVKVGADGRVQTASVQRSSGHAEFDQAALTAVRRWQFRPATRMGVSIAKEIAVPVRFEIRDENSNP
ncbi:MAG: TonB family protein [Planctomycetales bacterium]|nr:TonB family protein [Planctomycetales bacterium]